MNATKPHWIIALALPALCAACAATPGPLSQAREEKIYRTGSNLPVKDYGAANVEVRGAEVINPINRPMQGVLSKKPGG